ncbi:MAG: hypothetical protein L6Q92_06570 [Phycisphaerae bacterium]|nr:hypothetical protein [Phycisphaerae bacterium]
MLALIAAWLGLLMLLLAVAMLLFRAAFHDAVLPIVMYGSVLAMTLGGLVLLSQRKHRDLSLAERAQRTQAKIGIALALTAIVIVYLLVGRAQVLPR